MTVAPKEGKYIIGDVTTDGHTHVLHIGPHPLDEDPSNESMSTLRGDFPKATTSVPLSGNNRHHHAHSVTADPNTDETMIVGISNDSNYPHYHTKITKVEE